jgi:alpha-maltose-1-phosphate synthase
MHVSLPVQIYSRTYPPDVYCGAGVHVTHLSKELAKITDVNVKCFGTQNIRDLTLSVTGVPSHNISVPEDKKLERVIDALMRSILIASRKPSGKIVHAHDWYTYLAGFLAKKMWGIPLVVTVHSLEPMRPWKVDQVGQGGFNISSWMERTGLLEADAVITVSEPSKQDILKHFPVPKDKIHVIHNGVDLQVFSDKNEYSYVEKHGVSLDRPIVLFVGRVTRQKGIDYLLRAISYLPSDYQFVFCAGKADTEQYRKECLEKVNSLNSQRDIFWLEGLSGQQLSSFYSCATVFCCPSVYETYAIVNLEAMACDTCVVAAKVAGNRQQLIDGETAFLVDVELCDKRFQARNPEQYSIDLAKKIEFAVSSVSLREKVATAGKEFVRSNCSWERVARETFQLYKKVALI